jgi:hypothetical protein
MKRFGLLALVLLALFGLQLPTCAAISSTALIENSPKFDRSRVVYEGEVIREPMLRGDFGWINVSDGNNTIGVWADKKAILQIKRYGCYHHSGDRVKVTGIFHRSCPVHGGDLDIHAQSLEIVALGKTTDHPVKAGKYFWVVLSLGLAGVTCFGSRKH